MNLTNQMSGRSIGASAWPKLLFTFSFCLLQIFAFSEGMLKDSVSASKADSIKAAANQAAIDAAALKRENLNTVLEVVGSVVAIVIIILITWKMSSGSGKPVQAAKSTRSAEGESHQEVMARRMKMEKK